LKAAERQLSAAPLAAVVSGRNDGKVGQRQWASRRRSDEIERGRRRAVYLEAATGGAGIGGRALPGKTAQVTNRASGVSCTAWLGRF